MVTSPYGDGGSVRPPHPDLDELADLAAGVTDDTRLRAHVDACPECRALLTDITTASAAVAMELAALPTPPMPGDLVRRIDDAIAAERSVAPTEAPPVAPTEPTSPVPSGTVIPITGRQSFWRRHGGAFASSAAAAVVIAFASVLVVGHFRDDKGESGVASSAAGARANTAIVTASGINYNTRNLKTSLPSLLAHKPPAGAREVTSFSSQAGTTGSGGLTSGTGSTGGTPSATEDQAARTKALAPGYTQALSLPESLTALKTDPLALQQCLVNLEVPRTTPPLAIDLGLWNGKPAAIFVFAVETRTDQVAVLIAPAGCPTGEVLAYQRFAKPKP